jgi:hypothetical protein
LERESERRLSSTSANIALNKNNSGSKDKKEFLRKSRLIEILILDEK